MPRASDGASKGGIGEKNVRRYSLKVIRKEKKICAKLLRFLL
jgi:hypothetical protein